MMSKFERKHHWMLIIFAISLMVGIVAGLVLNDTADVDAYGLFTQGPERKAVLTVNFTTYEWWLLTWSDSQRICQLFIEHEGLPEPSEIDYFCGSQVLNDWLDTEPCVYSETITKTEHCPGFYLHLVNVTPGQREITVDLLPAVVYVNIVDCDVQPPGNGCESLPTLHLIGEEPLPNEHIINIQGQLGAEPFSCEGAECKLPLPATGDDGIPVTFWAESSFGDSSEVFTAKVRVIPWGDFTAPDQQSDDDPKWYVDILSSQYLGEIKSTCSQIWSAFPPVGGPPLWLSSPDHPDGLISSRPYYYLAGSLISQGMVNVDKCPDGGLESAEIANQCGLETAREMINEWQNQFNTEIIRISDETGVPAQLMKNIFSRESQFWPGFSATYDEAGLGHLSDLGADTVLLWNPSFFSQFCPLVLDTTVCQRGFGNLDIAEQEMLRGALVQKVNAACPDCPQGIDLRQANFSISIFARSLLANCEQVGQIIHNQTGRKAGEVSFYEDLWRFTLVNYNGGPGCLSNAIQQASANNYPLTWTNVIQFLEPGPCQASIDYVEDISSMPGAPQATPTVTGEPTLVLPSPTSTPTGIPAGPTQTPTSTPTGIPAGPTQTPTSTPDQPTQIAPTPTPTLEGYPAPEPTDEQPYPIQPTPTQGQPYP